MNGRFIENVASSSQEKHQLLNLYSNDLKYLRNLIFNSAEETIDEHSHDMVYYINQMM